MYESRGKRDYFAQAYWRKPDGSLSIWVRSIEWEASQDGRSLPFFCYVPRSEAEAQSTSLKAQIFNTGTGGFGLAA